MGIWCCRDGRGQARAEGGRREWRHGEGAQLSPLLTAEASESPHEGWEAAKLLQAMHKYGTGEMHQVHAHALPLRKGKHELYEQQLVLPSVPVSRATWCPCPACLGSWQTPERQGSIPLPLLGGCSSAALFTLI